MTKTDHTKIDLVQSIKADIDLVENNDGQIPGVKANPREMTEMEFRKLKKSLQRNPEFTAISELRLYPYRGKWVTIGGNMRLQAMRELGWTTVIGKPLAADTDPDTLNRYILLDNANFGKWDFDKLANEWNDEMLADYNIDIPALDEPQAEEEAKDDNCDVDELLQEHSDTRLGDIFRLGNHRLICGDSTEPRYIDALVGEEIIDCLITDPPYGVSYSDKNKALKKGNTKEIANDDKRGDDLADFLNKALGAAAGVMKQGAAYYVWYASLSTPQFFNAARKAFGDVKQNLNWCKNAFVLGRQDYQWKHEPCLYGWKEGAAHYFTRNRSLTTVLSKTREDVEKMSKDEMRDLLRMIYSDDVPKDVLEFDKPQRSVDHPTMKPVPLIGYLIKNSTRRGETVLDVFGGSGTTLIAAEQLGRRCLMVEYAPQYVDVIIRRWEELTGETAEYLGNINNTEEGAK